MFLEETFLEKKFHDKVKDWCYKHTQGQNLGKNLNFVQNESTFVHNMIGKTFLSVIYSFYQHFFYLAGGPSLNYSRTQKGSRMVSMENNFFSTHLPPSTPFNLIMTGS